MTRSFDLSSTTETFVPTDTLRALQTLGATTGLHWILIGATARDLVVYLPLGHTPPRITHDVDIVVAAEGFDLFTRDLVPRRGGNHAFQIDGVAIDVLPIPTGQDATTIEFSDGSVLNTIGIPEAASSPETVLLRRDLVLEVASIEAQCALKVLAWHDRHVDDPKDAVDLIALLEAGSEGLYADETWDDPDSLTATDHDIRLAGAYRFGRNSRALFTADRASVISDILLAPRTRSLLPQHARRASANELLHAYTRGFHEG
ncbi:nucleotidyl transferase AbiEii/AbiGii toxin family protein [Tessaracoccus caeni]|uniref:nucleotidyl transferase AbiEii/AbiGii toxin family protein n=1 Tax=Tessaracoccus caeni TaxID=3031239 RepID=UPI0023DA5303|nr:nucleotidyl transferase AbiEii/AbiGii toxin family protein [Tessaracoccus caeni]MDF1487196.1 nucleotidyl transferase AbiEii/AbiGii toxin family protein [Tessaracoccus caeni]